MAQNEVLHRLDIHRLDARRATPGRMGTSGTQPDQIGAQAVDTGSEAALADLAQGGVIQRDIRQALAGIPTTGSKGSLLDLPTLQEGDGVSIEGQATTHDLGTLGWLRLAIQRQIQAEAVEQLRAQLAFLGVHGADQHEARGMPMGDAVTLDMVDPAGGSIEQQIYQMIRQQVYLIDIEHAAIGAGQQAGGKLRAAFAQRCVQIQGADDALLAGAKRQGDEAPALQQVGQATGQCGLGHAARALDQHPTDVRIDGRQAQRQLQRIGADHGGEGEVMFGHGLSRDQ